MDHDYDQHSSPSDTPSPMGTFEIGGSQDIMGSGERPLGRKGEKERQKRKGRTNTLAAQQSILESCDKFREDYVQINQTRQATQQQFYNDYSRMVQIRQIEVEENLRAVEDAFMTKDISHMTETQKMYYHQRCQEMVEQRRARGFHFPGSSGSQEGSV